MYYFLFVKGDRWFSHKSKRYFISQIKADFQAASLYCEDQYNGSLVAINDSTENTVLNDIIRTLAQGTNDSAIIPYWIGLKDLNGTFTNAVWVSSNSSIPNWNLWYKNIIVNSSKLCAGAYIDNSTAQLRWINLNCKDRIRFICQLGRQPFGIRVYDIVERYMHINANFHFISFSI